MAGRKPKPSHLRLVGGNAGKRPINKKEPKVKKGAPIAPKWLSPKAKAAWPRAVKLLTDMGVLTVADGFALEMLCEAYADLLTARAAVQLPVLGVSKQKDGELTSFVLAEGGEVTYVTYGKNGAMIRNRPEYALIADAERRLKASLSDFGLTPAARSKIQANNGDQEEEPEEKYFQ